VKVTKFTCVSDHFEAVNKKIIIWYNIYNFYVLVSIMMLINEMTQIMVN